MWELTKAFRFEAAHALPGTTLGDASEEIHGHSFRAEVTIRGTADPATGMVLDLGLLEASMAEVRKLLDRSGLTEEPARNEQFPAFFVLTNEQGMVGAVALDVRQIVP
jgi:6-pyruvoyltetrahydropterin/6-carboxytetrahydropterin synthase